MLLAVEAGISFTAASVMTHVSQDESLATLHHQTISGSVSCAFCVAAVTRGGTEGGGHRGMANLRGHPRFSSLL